MASSSSSRKRKIDKSDDYSGGIELEMNNALSSGSKRKHTLDSDDEEDDDESYNQKKYDVMNEADIEGQEEGTEEFDGETKITPFNMKDELEDGYFDGSGMYIWNKRDKSEVKDSWLDSIDWVKVKHTDEGSDQTEAKPKGPKIDDGSSDEEDTEPIVTLYEKVIRILNPGESMLQAIKRLGGGKQLSASERLKQKKLAKLKGESMDTSKPADSVDQKKMAELTDLANRIMTGTGNMDVYAETYESLKHKIQLAEPPSPPPPVAKPVDDDGQDMFSDEYAVKA